MSIALFQFFDAQDDLVAFFVKNLFQLNSFYRKFCVSKIFMAAQAYVWKVTLYRVGQKTGPFSKAYNSCIWWRRRSIYHNVQRFISNKTGI